MEFDPLGLRASHSDRTRVESELRIAFSDGRLSIEELDARLQRLHTAQTYADLKDVVFDIPGGDRLVDDIASAHAPKATSDLGPARHGSASLARDRSRAYAPSTRRTLSPWPMLVGLGIWTMISFGAFFNPYGFHGGVPVFPLFIGFFFLARSFRRRGWRWSRW